MIEDISREKLVAQEREMLFASEHAARLDAEEANRTKDEFLATLSHELRTPLNAILGWTQMLQRKAVTPDRVDAALEALDRNARKQAQLVDDLLELSRIAAGRLQAEPRARGADDGARRGASIRFSRRSMPSASPSPSRRLPRRSGSKPIQSSCSRCAGTCSRTR